MNKGGNFMILLCGKTSSGKTFLQKELIKIGYKSIVTYTTRPPRNGEVDGIAYHFVTKEEFLHSTPQNYHLHKGSPLC